MRHTPPALILVAVSLVASAQQPVPPRPKATTGASAPANPADRQARYDSAVKFVEASDARHRLAEVIDKLLEDGRQTMMQKNPGLDPQFGQEWLKRMRQRVSLDQFVITTAQVYAKYFTSAELDELTQGQLAMKKGQIYSLPAQLGAKLKTNSASIQQDINRDTSLIGGRLGSEVGKEIEKEHPEWVKKLNASTPSAQPTH